MSLYIETHGSGRDLLLIHGWGMHGGVWQPIIKKLARHFCLHIVDLPGMGYSQPIEPGHLYAVAEKVLEVMPANADVCGWSLGGTVAMRIALLQPDLVRRLVLVSSSPCFVNGPEITDWQDGIATENLTQFAAQVSQDYRGTLKRFFSLQCQGASDARSINKQLRSSFAERPTPTSATLQKALKILLVSDLRDEITGLTRPALLIHGDRDTLAPVQAAHWLAQHLPFGCLRVIAGAAHAPFLSHTDQFMAALVEFLEPSA